MDTYHNREDLLTYIHLRETEDARRRALRQQQMLREREQAQAWDKRRTYALQDKRRR